MSAPFNSAEVNESLEQPGATWSNLEQPGATWSQCLLIVPGPSVGLPPTCPQTYSHDSLVEDLKLKAPDKGREGGAEGLQTGSKASPVWNCA